MIDLQNRTQRKEFIQKVQLTMLNKFPKYIIKPYEEYGYTIVSFLVEGYIKLDVIDEIQIIKLDGEFAPTVMKWLDHFNASGMPSVIQDINVFSVKRIHRGIHDNEFKYACYVNITKIK